MDSEKTPQTQPDPEMAICEKCQTEFQYLPISFSRHRIFKRKWCDPCAKILSDEHEKKLELEQREEKLKKIASEWNRVCPPLYQDTDASRINQQCATAALQWRPDDTKGLGLLGVSGAGKTRALFLALKTAVDSGLRCEAITHAKFSRIVQEAFAGDGDERPYARAILEKLRTARVIMIDDIGKPPATERADSELEELIEHRVSNLVTILWSANGSSEWLIKRFGVDRGQPIVRRLAEFSTIVKI